MAKRKRKTKEAALPDSSWAWLRAHFYAQYRFVIGLAVGVAVFLTVPFNDVLPRVLAGWNAGGWVYFILVAVKMWNAEAEGIKREADIERESRIAVAVIVVLGSLVTLLALVAQLGAIKSEHGVERTISIALSVSTILLSWLLIHLVFAVFYAHEFHSEHGQAGASGAGLKFPDDRIPDYIDFLYFSYVVGTTAQTSDVDVTSRAMRFIVMLHGLLSFFFNATVIALTVNLAAALVQGG